MLVNVTAGMDLAIGEFHTVGETVKEYASDDATVVVGTVIDPDMTNQIRVTVVATGLGQPMVGEEPAPMRVVTPNPTAEAPNYSDFDRPTRHRKQAVGEPAGQPQEPSFDLLDIPAFLRRQAD